MSFLTGIHDIDREILYNTLDEKLFLTCLINKYTQEVCNETFWRNKFIRKFEVDLGNHIVYRDLYRQLAPLSDEKLLHISAKEGYLPLVKKLVKIGVDIHCNNSRALRYAAKKGHFDVVKYLIESPLGSSIKYSEFCMALHLGAKNKHFDVVKYLFEYIPGRKSAMLCNNLMYNAVLGGNLEIVKYLIAKRVNIHRSRESLLHLASTMGNWQIFKFLIDHGYNVHATDIGTLLQQVETGRLGITKDLLDRGIYTVGERDAVAAVAPALAP